MKDYFICRVIFFVCYHTHRVQLTIGVSWHTVNISPRLCKDAAPVRQYEALHPTLEGNDQPRGLLVRISDY